MSSSCRFMFFSFIASILALALTAPVSGAATPPDTSTEPPPFKAGEIAVYASPQELPGYQVVKYLPHAGISVVQAQPGREMAAVQALRAKGKRAGLNLLLQAFAAPNDTYYPYQWHFPAVQAGEAWNISTGTGVTVAVLDTGLATNGPDGIACITSGWNSVANDGNYSDGNGHGTHVAGTIAQSTNNNTGVAGLAYGSCIMPVKVLNDSGSGTIADIADGIYYAVDYAKNYGPVVINMSLGTDAHQRIKSDPILDPALDYAYGAGVSVIAAAGNDGFSRNVSYPATHATTLAVGATDIDNRITSYSNSGTGLDLMAPGGTTADANGDGYQDGVLQETNLYDGAGWQYWFLTGTSMATPHVSAIAAMLISKGTATSPDDIKQALTEKALDLGDSGFDKTYGHGLVQAYDALGWTAGSGSEPPPANEPPTVVIDSPTDGASFASGVSILFEGTASDTEDGDLTSSLVWTSDLDGQIGTGGNFSLTLSDGTHTITAEAVDVASATGSDSITITVGSDPATGGGITLTTTGYKVKGRHNVDLNWSGATTTNVDIYRDGSLIATTANDGVYTDKMNQRGSASYTYQLCEEGASTCSATVTVVF